MLDFSYRIEGAVNNEPVLGDGRGSFSSKSGESEMRVSFLTRPVDWDPRSILLICCARVFAAGARADHGATNLVDLTSGRILIGGSAEAEQRQGRILGADGRSLLSVKASSETHLASPPRVDRTVVEGGISRLRPGDNGISRIDSLEGVMIQSAPGRIALMTSFRGELESGEVFAGYSYYPHVIESQLKGLDGPQQFSLEAVEQSLVGDELRLWTRTAVQPLHAISPRLRVLRDTA